MQRHPITILALLSVMASTQGCYYDGEEGEVAEASDEIFNGTAVPAADSGIVMVTGGNKQCSGALLSNQWVMTAKQCVDNASLQGNPGQVTVSMDTQSSAAIEIILLHNRDVALIRTLPFSMFGSTTGFSMPTYRSSVTGITLACYGYGPDVPGGSFGTLRSAQFQVTQNGTLVPNVASQLPSPADTGGVCFRGVNGRLVAAAVISTCTNQSCALTPTNLFRGWLGVTRTTQDLVTASGLCVEVPGFSFASGTGITQSTCANSFSQKWRFEHMGGSDYRIRAKHDGYCLTVPPGGGSGAQLVQAPCASGNFNQFWFISPSGGSAVIQGAPWSSASGLCLDVRGGSGAGAGAAIQVHTCHGGSNQRFGLRVEPEEGTFELSNPLSGKCMEVPGGAMGEADMVQSACDMGLDQLYRFERVAQGTHVVHPAHSGLCVDLEGLSMTAGAPIQQWTSCNGQTNQRWALDFNGDGTYLFRSLHSGMCASVPSGNAITQQSCGSSVAWRLAY